MINSVRRSVSTWAISVGLMAVTVSALAGPQPKRSLDPVVTVHFADLKTSTTEGSQILYARISAAALAVCSGGADWYPSQYWAGRDCYRATVDRVVARLNLPLLTALHHAQPQPVPDVPARQVADR
jgi:UrcA family protein